MQTTKARTWKQALRTPRTSLTVKKSGGKKYVVVNICIQGGGGLVFSMSTWTKGIAPNVHDVLVGSQNRTNTGPRSF